MNKPEASLLSEGEIVGTYKIVRRLGRGGMGEVYLAWEEELQRNVAIKILTPEAIGDKETVERFKGEGRALARLKHPNVISLYQFGEKGKSPYIVMEYIEGTTLDMMIRRHPLGVPEIIQIAKQILSGLAVAHEAGIIHRDVKPENIIVDKDLNAKILDFGIAKVHFDQKSVNTALDVLVGTMNYVAPEIIMGKMASRQSDIYSMGLTIFYMLQGSIPYEGRNNLAILEKIRTVDVKFAANFELILPDPLKRTILRMTARDVKMRYADARDVIRDLEQISLQNLPHELRLSPEPYLEISNRKDVESYCTSKGFDMTEARVIINLAAGLDKEKAQSAMQTKSEDIDDTTFAGERPEYSISTPALDEAIQKYRALKTRMITRRMKMRAPVKKTPMWQLVAGGAAAFCAAAFLAQKILFKKAQGVKVASTSVAAPAASASQAARAVSSTKPQDAVVSHKPAKPLNLELQILPKGTRIEYRVQTSSGKHGKGAGEETWVVADVSNGRVRWLINGNETVETSVNPFVPPLETTGKLVGREDIERTTLGEDSKIFPLKPGNSMDITVSGRQRNQRVVTYNYKCVVAEGVQKFRSPVGDLDVIELNCVGQGSINFSTKYLYSPELGAIVLHDRKGSRDQGFSLRKELIGYRRP